MNKSANNIGKMYIKYINIYIYIFFISNVICIGLSVSISISLSSCHWAYSVYNLNEHHDNWFVYYSPCLPLWDQKKNVLWILELLIHFYFEEISSSDSLIIWASFLYHCLLDISYCMFYRYFKQRIYKSELIETSRCPILSPTLQLHGAEI